MSDLFKRATSTDREWLCIDWDCVEKRCFMVRGKEKKRDRRRARARLVASFRREHGNAFGDYKEDQWDDVWDYWSGYYDGVWWNEWHEIEYGYAWDDRFGYVEVVLAPLAPPKVA